MLKKSKILIAGILLFTSNMCSAQQVQITPVGISEDVAISNIVAMIQDNNGFIWIADNNNGLFKYDGNNMIQYKPETDNPNSIASGKLECLYQDKKGNIWIGTFQNGLDRFEPETETFAHFKHDYHDTASVCSDSIRAIVEDDDGILWIGTANGLDRLDTETGKFKHMDKNYEDALLLSKEHVRALYKDRAGTIWIGCGSPFKVEEQKSLGGLYKWDKSNGKFTRYHHDEQDSGSLIDNRVRAIFEDSHGVFWVGTSGDGLHIMNRKNGTFKRCLYNPKNANKLSRPALTNTFSYSNDHITFINEDNQGYIWIGTFSGGINRYNPALNIMEHFGKEGSGVYKTVRNDYWTCLKTRDNLVWVSVWQPDNNSQALYRISTSNNKLNYSRIGKVVIDFAQDQDSSMWFATNRGLIHKTKSNTYDSFFVNQNKAGQESVIFNLESDPENNLWVSTRNGLYYFNKKTNAFTGGYLNNDKMLNSLSADSVTATLLNGDGTMWIGTVRGLDLMNIKTGTFKHYKNNPTDSTSISGDFIRNIVKDKAGNVWIGTSKGLSRINMNTRKFKNFFERQMQVYSIFEDSHNRLWVGTLLSGLYVYDHKADNFLPYRDSTGLLENGVTVFGITEDHQHSLWLNASPGFIWLNTTTKNATVFGKSWAINSDVGTNVAFTSSGGEIFFGDTAGYYHFLPNSFEKGHDNAPQPFISKFYLGNTLLKQGVNEILSLPLSKTEKINLRYNQNTFTIEFNNVDFVTSQTEKSLQYKLEGYDDVWRKGGGENRAYYYNVPPGNYVFKVKATNMFSKLGEKSMAIVIAPPWYKTWWAYALFALLAIGILRTYIVYRSRKLRKENKSLEEKVTLRTAQLQGSIDQLKSTQSQLIQSEKMASLGELTAGIAHEIQNPLNFVNNFSEVNNELIEELKSQKATLKSEEQDELLDDIFQNNEKINHHGKRADAIVKGMLQHSRKSEGVKEPTDINALCDEYLRLSYHGLRAKDKDFNAEIKTDFDESIGKINIVPQDIGRVVLNLFNNAFYAVNERYKAEGEKQKALNPTPSTLHLNYKPLVSIQAKKLNDKVEIRVEDNGNGIPQNIVDKIFQPFFTTKPTGQGTGLGLSLAYDIIKTHGGEIKVELREGEGTQFIIKLPIN